MAVPWAELCRFGLAGAVNVALTFAAYALMVESGVPYLVANLIAWILGIVCAYFLNLLFVFREAKARPPNARQFTVFGAIYSLNFGLSSLVLMALVECRVLGPVEAQFVVIPLVVLLNFASSKFVVFKGAVS